MNGSNGGSTSYGGSGRKRAAAVTAVAHHPRNGQQRQQRHQLSPDECGQLYEDAQCRYQQVQQQLNLDENSSNRHNSNNRTGATGEEGEESLVFCRDLLARTRRWGVLQCAASASTATGSSPNNDLEATTAARQLLERIRLEDNTADGDEKIFDMRSRVLGSMVTMPPYPPPPATNHKPAPTAAVVPVDADAFFDEYPHCCKPDDADDGGEDDYSDGYGSSGEEEEEVDEDDEVQVVKTTKPPGRQQQQQQQQSSSSASAVRRSPGGPPAVQLQQQQQVHVQQQQHQQQPPFRSQQQQQQCQQQPADPSPPLKAPPPVAPVLPPPSANSSSNNNTSNYQNSCSHQRPTTNNNNNNSNTTAGNNTNSSWEDHRCQNPFQTAREYAHVGGAGAGSSSNNNSRNSNNFDYDTLSQNQYQQRQLQHQQHQQPPSAGTSNNTNTNITINPYYPQQQQPQQQQPPPPPPGMAPPPPVRGGPVVGYNPYLNNPQQSQSLSPAPPPPPPIRESLKRKFQLPTKRGDQQPNSNGGGKATGVASISRRPTSANGGGQRQRDNTNNNSASKDDNDGADDEELPEELQRYGKDLVRKIQDEIMDAEAGDPITFDTIAGLDDAKQTVQEVVCWPMKRPDLFTGLRSAPNGLLLYGPPGTGKTLIGKAIAHESGATFFSISSSSLTSKWIGEGEKLVRTLFAVAAYYQPAVVFIDEIDSLLTQRKADENEASRRMKTEFLVQLDGTSTSGQGRVLVIGATNRPQELDEAARRRFTKRLYIPLPEEADREKLLRVLLETNHHRLTDDDVKKLAKDTAGFSGADLKSLSTDAAMGPIRSLGARALQVEAGDVPPITYKHFRQALRGTKPSVAPADLVQYVEWDNTYGSRRMGQEEEEEEELDDEDDNNNSKEDDH